MTTADVSEQVDGETPIGPAGDAAAALDAAPPDSGTDLGASDPDPDSVRWWRLAGTVPDDIRLAHATFARATAARMRAVARSEVELSLAAAEWVTGGDWLMSANEPVTLAWVELPGAPAGMAMRLDTRFALHTLERMLGGTGTDAGDRQPTDLDLTLLHDVFAAPVGAIDLVLGPDLTAAPRLALVVSRPAMLRLAAPTDPMLLLTYQVEISQPSAPVGMLTLAYPEDVVTRVLVHAERSARVVPEPSGIGDPALRSLLTEVDVEVVARLQPARFSVDALRTLRVGDVVSLDHRRDQPVELSVGGVPMLDGALGRRGRNVAVRVECWRPACPEPPQEPAT